MSEKRWEECSGVQKRCTAVLLGVPVARRRTKLSGTQWLGCCRQLKQYQPDATWRRLS